MGVAYTGKNIVLNKFSPASPNGFVEAIRTACLGAEWVDSYGIKASIRLYLNSSWGDDNVVWTGNWPPFYIGAQRYQLKYNTINNAISGEILIPVNPTVEGVLQNIKAAINNEAGSGTLYSSATPINSDVECPGFWGGTTNYLLLQARVGGPNGNSIPAYVPGLAYPPSVEFTKGGVWEPGNGTNHLMGGGYALDATSPQNFQMRLKVFWDREGGYKGHIVVMQICSTYDETKASFPHIIFTQQTPNDWQVWADCCQIFVSRPGYGNPAFQAGIPYVPIRSGSPPEDPRTPGCYYQGTARSEIWWSAGDAYGHPIIMANTLRQNWEVGWCDSCCIDGVYRNWQVGTANCEVKVIPLGDSEDTYFPTYWPVRWFPANEADTDTPLRLDPLIMFNTDGSLQATIQGEMWDSYINTVHHDWEWEETFDGNIFINYLHQADPWGPYAMPLYGSLMLMKGFKVGSGQIRNYVY